MSVLGVHNKMATIPLKGDNLSFCGCSEGKKILGVAVTYFVVSHAASFANHVILDHLLQILCRICALRS